MAERAPAAPAPEIQTHSKLWWETNPMSYDWRRTLPYEEGTAEFFDAIDRRFFLSSPFYRGTIPFGRLIPFDRLRGKRVLEIGCGLGAHAELMSRAGCRLSCIDLTERAVSMTRRRLALRGVTADVQRMDAEKMIFPDEEFDFVWSWGVIHHSSNTAGIVEQVYRVLKPSGEFRSMVYHRRSLWAYLSYLRGFFSGKYFKEMSGEEILSAYTDGHLARYYTKAEFTALLARCGFSTIETRTLGQMSELLPIPGKGMSGRVKAALLAKFPARLAEIMLSGIGSFLFAIARKNSSSPAL
jgi:2-polyprenyl-3-methyl-5-hydroxy-6-metoxy-1,4-benzoquinol methylase